MFFTLSLNELIKDYIMPLNRRTNGVYVVDLRKIKDSRIQVDYSSGVLWNDKLRTLIDCYKDPSFMRALLASDNCSDAKFVETFKDKPKEKLREAIIENIKTWLDNYTFPFNINDLQKYRERNQTYILVPCKIKVKY